MENIINQCPSSGGKAVYEARALYNKYVNDSIVFEGDSLCTSSLRTMSTITNVIKTEAGYCRIYPNPANDYLNVEYLLSAQEKHSRFVLSDISGRIVHEKTLQSINGRFSIDISEMRKGIYFCYMQSGRESKFHQKVVIVR